MSAAPWPRLRTLLAERAALARACGRAQLVVVRTSLPAAEAVDPLRLFAAGSAAEARFFLEQPRERRAIAACGAVATLEGRGGDRFPAAVRALRELCERLVIVEDGPADAAAPLLVGGFGFAPDPEARRPGRDLAWSGFGDLRFVLPERLVMREGERAWVAIATRVEPGDGEDELAAKLAPLRAGQGETALRLRAPGDLSGEAAPEQASLAAQSYSLRPDGAAEDYRRLVAEALDAIRKGELEKVVVARAVEVEAARAFEAPALLAELRRSHPACATFAVAPAAGAGGGAPVFAGSTPELLARVRAGWVEAAAVAGTAPRGRTRRDDAALGRALRTSAKERAEHACVVREIERAMAPLCDAIERPAEPELLALDGLQHLATPLRGRLRAGSGVGLLEVVGALHPTPAVAGAPREAAERWLEARERLARGWYGGGVGFLDAAGGGELHVALRCALLRERQARLFAGAGVVEGSLPEAELRETRLKLRTLLEPLLEL